MARIEQVYQAVALFLFIWFRSDVPLMASLTGFCCRDGRYVGSIPEMCLMQLDDADGWDLASYSSLSSSLG
jgi:hypothetical protein